MKLTKAAVLIALVALPGVSQAQLPPREPRTTLPVAERAKDIHGDKTTAALREEISFLETDMRLLADQYQQQQNRLNTQISRLTSIVNEREQAVAFIRREGEQKFYTVKTGSLRQQMEELRFALGLQRIRWDQSVPAHCDWQFDASFQIDKSNQIRAMETFLSGLPLLPQLNKRDNSVTISAMEVIKCG